MNKFNPMKKISGDFELKAQEGAFEHIMALVRPQVVTITLPKEKFNLVPRKAILVFYSEGKERYFKVYRRDSKTCKVFGREVVK